MSGEVFIMKSGGGVKHKYGFWRVNFPAGSSCTLTNGTRTYKAPDDAVSLGRYTFPIPENGSWTVTCTDGTHTASKTLTFSNKYSYYVSTLSYALILFNNGAVAGCTWTGLTNNGKTLSLSVSDSTGYGNSANGSSVETIDMSGYTTLKFHVVSSDTTGSYSGGVTLGTDGATVNFSNESNVIKSVNVSNISSGKILFSVSANSSGSGNSQSCKVVVDKIWLE